MNNHQPNCQTGAGASSSRADAASSASTQLDYELLRLIGKGSYGEVWLAREKTGAYRAVKVVFRASFDHDRPYEREYEGIRKFEPVSRSYQNQVQILHVGRQDAAGRFYYIMELADDQRTGQEIDPSLYAPKTLKSELKKRGRLPVDACLRIGAALAGALENLHQHGLIHRDIKPANIIFVKDVPKLADIGLVTDRDVSVSYVGTEGYIPPEGPSSAQADIFSLGKVLYEMATGRDRMDFPELPTNLEQLPDHKALLELNAIIAKACARLPKQRYKTAREMNRDLVRLQERKSIRRAALFGEGMRGPFAIGAAVSICALAAVAAHYLRLGHKALNAGSTRMDTPSQPAATKERPWTNTLGMGFVPVPGTKVLFSIWETRVQDFERFANQTGYDTGNRMMIETRNGWSGTNVPGHDWRQPGLSQGPTHPVVGVSTLDAEAFCHWLTEKETSEGRLTPDQSYRLPTDEEWSWAVGIGDRESGSTPAEKSGKLQRVYPWGAKWPPPNDAGNYSGEETATGDLKPQAIIRGHQDGFVRTAPVGSFKPDTNGIFDLGGNVWEWCGDWFDTTKKRKVIRGGGCLEGRREALLSDCRLAPPPDQRDCNVGFRVVLEGALEEKFAASGRAGPSDEPGFVPLFNGHDLSGWDGDPRHWAVSEGAIVGCFTNLNPGRGGDSCTQLIWTNGVLEDFELRLSCKVKANGGVFYRSQRLANWHTGGYRFDIHRADTALLFEAGHDRGECLLARPGQKTVARTLDGKAKITEVGKTAGTAEIEASLKPEWNELVIIARGNHLIHKLNGLVMVDVTDARASRPQRGVLALELLHSGMSPPVYEYKDIRLRRLDHVASGPVGPTLPVQSIGARWTNSLGMIFAPVSGTEVRFSIWETRVQDYQHFVSSTSRPWQKPGFEQGPTHPAVLVSWRDAQAFCTWLTRQEQALGRLSANEHYRLATDAEWSLAVGLTNESAGTPRQKNEAIKDVYPWGSNWPPPLTAGNFGERADGYTWTAPCGSFEPNVYGLYDLGGNVWEWCDDCYDAGQEARVCRGASFFREPDRKFVLSSHRSRNDPGYRYNDSLGFRVVLSGRLDEAQKQPAVKSTQDRQP
jgi:formylglycine-generating enzyme required for sulfatase activity